MPDHYIPLSVPNLKGNELAYITHAVETEWVSTAGPYVTDFEKSLASYVGTQGAVACQSGTAGLHVGLQLCGVVPGDLVIVPTLTFIAAVNPVKYLGADPVFMDCDESLCLDPAKLEAFCREECVLLNDTLFHKTTKKRIPVLVVVHVFGNMADMENLLRIAGKYRLRVVEDATEALGTRYTEGPLAGLYAGAMGDIGVYSFNGNKIITTGGGGMIVSKDENLLIRARHLTTQAKSDELNFLHDEVGYNYRMTNLQAAMGLAQLEQLEHFIEVKTSNYHRYTAAVADIPGLSMLSFRQGTRSNHWFYSLCCNTTYPLGRDDLIEAMKTHRIQVRPVWGLIHMQKPYLGSLEYHIVTAQHYWSRIVNLPCSTNLSVEDLNRVVTALKQQTRRCEYEVTGPIH